MPHCIFLLLQQEVYNPQNVIVETSPTSLPNLEKSAKQALFTVSLWGHVELFTPTPCQKADFKLLSDASSFRIIRFAHLYYTLNR